MSVTIAKKITGFAVVKNEEEKAAEAAVATPAVPAEPEREHMNETVARRNLQIKNTTVRTCDLHDD
jgi:hypothetical protein